MPKSNKCTFIFRSMKCGNPQPKNEKCSRASNNNTVCADLATLELALLLLLLLLWWWWLLLVVVIWRFVSLMKWKCCHRVLVSAFAFLILAFSLFFRLWFSFSVEWIRCCDFDWMWTFGVRLIESIAMDIASEFLLAAPLPPSLPSLMICVTDCARYEVTTLNHCVE